MERSESVAMSPLNDSIREMEENLLSWREHLNSNNTELMQKHLDRFILAAREGLRVMAMKHGHNPDTAEDIAQACILNLLQSAENSRPPFSPHTIDAVVSGPSTFPRSPGLPGSNLGAYLYGMLSNYVCKQDRRIKNRKRRVADYERESAESTGGENRLMSKPDNVIRNVSNSLNKDLITQIHDEYLDHTLYKGRPLREVLGAWTPMLEWTGMCDIAARPQEDVISETSLRRHMDVIKDLIVSAKNATLPFGAKDD